MPADAADNHEPVKGLPPVEPPSARFIVQLFLLPGMIIAVLLVIFFGATYLVHSPHTREGFLNSLDSSNPEVRWRGANDLAQVLKRPESLALASDPVFALEIAERLRKANEELDREEAQIDEQIKKNGNLSPQEKDLQWRKLRQQRNLVLFLTACLGDFTVPVGITELNEIALKDTGPDLKSLAQRRQRAVVALGNLGSNYQRRYLGKNAGKNEKVLTAAQKDAILADLERESHAASKRGQTAGATLDFLRGKKGSDVDVTLEKCIKADDFFLRELIALALNFWDGDRVEPTLVELSKDQGKAKRIEIDEDY